MAALYGTLEGHRGAVSRTGSKDSGIVAVLQTWGGQARLTLQHDGTAELSVGHPTRGNHRVLWTGNVDDLSGSH